MKAILAFCLIPCLVTLTSTELSFAQQPASGQYRTSRVVIEGKDFGYFFGNSRWPSETDGSTKIPVCWEQDAVQKYPVETKAVEQAVYDSWEIHSRIAFIGWQRCSANNSGIRIIVQDSGARVKKFGKNLNRVVGGMELNFTFKNWNQSCGMDTLRMDCIRSIAVHEFGHAIGFAHEQDHPDTPGECARSMGTGTTGTDLQKLTPYDPDSVMNYCNPEYNNNGQLSKRDVQSVQQKYGSRS